MIILGLIAVLIFWWENFSVQYRGRNPDEGAIDLDNYVYCSNLIFTFPKWVVKVLFFNTKQTKLPLFLVIAQALNYCMFFICLATVFFLKGYFYSCLFLTVVLANVICFSVIIQIDYTIFEYKQTHINGKKKFSKPYKKKDAKEKLNQILEIVHNKNMTAFKNLFSKMVLKQVPDFDQKAGALFDYFQCNSFTHKGLNAMNEKQTWNNGSRQQIVDLSYNVKTDCTAYFLVIRVYIEDTKNEENVGIYSLHIFNLEEGLTQRQVLELETRFDEMDNSLFLPGIYLEV